MHVINNDRIKLNVIIQNGYELDKGEFIMAIFKTEGAFKMSSFSNP